MDIRPKENKKGKTIAHKITVLLLAMASAALALTGTASIWSLRSMKRISAENGEELGRTAAEDAERALEKVAGEQLVSLAGEKAVYIEEKFNTVMAYVHGIAAQAEEIYAHPEAYPDRMVALPVRDSTLLAAQLLWSESLASPTEEQWAELLKLGNLQDLLVQYNANNDMVSSTYLATVSGWMIQADYIADSKYADDSDLPTPYEAQERQWFQRACMAGQGQIVFSDVIEDVHEGGDCIVCAQPVFQGGDLVAVAGLGCYLDTVNEAVLNTTVGGSGYAFLVNQEGRVMVSPKEEGETAASAESGYSLCQSDNLILAEAVEDVLFGYSGLEELELDGRQVYLAYAPLEKLGWGFLVVMDVEEVIAPAVAGQEQILALSSAVAKRQNEAIRMTLLSFIAILAVTGVAMAAAGMLFGRQIADPIRRLTCDVEKIGSGSLNYRIEIATGDEVEELGNAFNAMTAQLREYIFNLAAVTAEKERIKTELTVAAGIQKDMLPDAGAFRNSRAFSLNAFMTPAKEVGGDFYDFFLLDENRLAVIVADVSGKGVPAALFMVIAKSRLRACLASEASLEKALEKANDSLCAENKNGMFVTVWAGILNLSDGTLTYVNAGHCRPLVKHGDGSFSYLTEQGGFVLAGMERVEYCQSVVTLSPGDMLFQCTDGVLEANDSSGNFYGEDRLEQLLNSGEREAEQVIPAVWADVQRFQGGAEQFDDITMLSLYYKGSYAEEVHVAPVEVGRLEEICGFIEERLESAALPERDRAKVMVAVDEILSNIFRYSGASEVETVCRIREGRVQICFSDDGTPFNPLRRPEPDLEEEVLQRPIGGLGIYIVKNTMDEVTYEYSFAQGRNRLTIVKESAR